MIETNSKIENVLLLNMSTLPNRDSLDTNYYYKRSSNGKYIFKGISQLEAGTKFIISRLALRGIKLDRIVVTASPETLEYHRAVGCNAFEYYKSRIINYVSGRDKGTDGEKVLEELKDKLKKSESDNSSKIVERIAEEAVMNSASVANKITELYKDKGNDLIRMIEMEGIGTKDISTIRKINDEVMGGSSSVKVYIDVQGGDRSFTYILNALMALSEDNRIRVEKAISTKFTPGSIIHEIDYSTEAFKLVSFITAVKAFISYGRADLLTHYFNDAGYSENSSEREFVKAINDVSDAIQVCSPYYMSKSIGQLKNIIIDNKEFSDPFLEFVRGDIIQSYGSILNNDDNDEDTDDIDIIELVKWAYQNGFLQQALTIIESLAPEQMTKDGIFYYCKTEEEQRKVKELLTEQYIEANEGKKYDFDNISHYIFRKLYSEYATNKKETELLMYVLSDKYDGPVNAYTEADRELVRELIDAYFEVKNIRNAINHALDKYSDIREEGNKAVKNFLEKYAKAKKSIIGFDAQKEIIRLEDIINSPYYIKKSTKQIIDNEKRHEAESCMSQFRECLLNGDRVGALKIIEDEENSNQFLKAFFQFIMLIYTAENKSKKIGSAYANRYPVFNDLRKNNVLGKRNRKGYLESKNNAVWRNLLNTAINNVPKDLYETNKVYDGVMSNEDFKVELATIKQEKNETTISVSTSKKEKTEIGKLPDTNKPVKGKKKTITQVCDKMLNLLHNNNLDQTKILIEGVENEKFAGFLEGVCSIYIIDKSAKKIEKEKIPEGTIFKQLVEEDVLNLNDKEQYYISKKNPLWVKLLNLCKTNLPASFK